jgi:hypothetical protein
LRSRWGIDRDDLPARTAAVDLDLKAIVHREIVLTDRDLKAIGLSVPQRTNSLSSSEMA